MKIFWTFVQVFGAAVWFGAALGLLSPPLWAQTLAFFLIGLSCLADAIKRWTVEP